MSSIERGQPSQMNAARGGVQKPGEEAEEKPTGPVKKNDIRDIRSYRGLARVNLDLDSPRMKEAMRVCGVSENDLEKK